jgi:hypothetical protein
MFPKLDNEIFLYKDFLFDGKTLNIFGEKNQIYYFFKDCIKCAKNYQLIMDYPVNLP